MTDSLGFGTTHGIFADIENCRICSTGLLDLVLNLGCQPPANSLRAPSDELPPIVPLRLMRCRDCSTVQLSADVNPDYLFSNYLWVTGTSAVATEYAKQFAFQSASLVAELGGSNSVVEIASNDGTFLREFQRLGWTVLGVDPAKNLCETAINDGVPTRCDFFDESVAESILNDGFLPGLIVARNVIPHVKNIHGVIRGIVRMMAPQSLGVIEFHKCSLLLDQLQYDYIYHEHLFYFSLKTMSSLLSIHGVQVFDVRESSISGGSWVVYFSAQKQRSTSRLNEALKLEQDSGINQLSSWMNFREGVVHHRKKLRDKVQGCGKPILAYGASARSATLLNWCGFTADEIFAVVDKNPLKTGLICPGSEIPIISLDGSEQLLKSQSVILLLAWNFEDEIVAELNKLGFSGSFIVPLPNQIKLVE